MRILLSPDIGVGCERGSSVAPSCGRISRVQCTRCNGVSPALIGRVLQWVGSRRDRRITERQERVGMWNGRSSTEWWFLDHLALRDP